MRNIRSNESIVALRRAFSEQRLSLFLGAGISLANGLPTWEKLVLSLYFSTISEQNMNGWRPFANYLYAISEWYLQQSNEPLEIISRKVKSFYENSDAGEQAFLEAIRDAIYGVDTYINPDRLLSANNTLSAIVKLCSAKRDRRYGIRSVITYNYDSLLEMTLDRKRPFRAVYSKHGDISDHQLPIFHVHGYVPYHKREIDKRNSAVIFTEEQYNSVASDPYSWSNIVQLREMSSGVGLMVGLSLSDRNIRRLLDALCQSPLKPKIFALLKTPDKKEVAVSDVDSVHLRAIEILSRFSRSGIKSSRMVGEKAGFMRQKRNLRGINASAVKSTKSIDAKRNVSSTGRKDEKRYQYEIRGIIERVELLEQEQQQNVLRQLGIVPIWYNDHREIPEILAKISGPQRP